MMRISRIISFVILAVLVVLLFTAWAADRLQEVFDIDLQPGESAQVNVSCAECALCPVCPTATVELTDTAVPPTAMPTATDTPEPTNTPVPPTPTPGPSVVWHGVLRTDRNDWPQIRSELGASVVEHLVRPSDSDAETLAALDEAQALGLGVLVHIHDGSTATDMPWWLDGGAWQISARGAEILALTDHPAVWAVYQLEEPWDYTSDGFVDADGQRALYTFLKSYTDAALYTEHGSLWRAAEEYDISDGMCDKCSSAPTTFRGSWTSEQCLAETFSRIDADFAAWQMHMPASDLVFMFNAYQLGDGSQYRLPTVAELEAVRDYMCGIDIPPLYYTWSGYDANLSTATHLWPSIAAGCNGAPPVPTDTPEPSPTNMPGPTATDTLEPTATSVPPTATPTETPPPPTNTPPPPTATPAPSGAIVIDHNNVDAGQIPQVWLDAVRGRSHFFNHKSVGNNIIDGMNDLAAQGYTLNIQYSSGTANGLNEYQTGSNQQPYTKIDGFAGRISDGHDVAFMKFCMGDIAPWTGYSATDVWVRYRDMMEAEQAQHPGTELVWWTIPLVTASRDRSGGNAEKAEFNGYVRDYVAAHGGVLFDIADIESHTPGGTAVVDSGGYPAAYDDYTSDGGHLNEMGRQRVASALWWMMARAAGWSGE